MASNESVGAAPAQRGLMLLSIHPKHVCAILAGSKLVELRRTRPAIQPGQPIAIYATAPTSSMVATCRVEKITIGAPNDVRAQLQSQAGVSGQEYVNYFQGAQLAVGIHVRDVRLLEEQVELEHLRKQTRFYPPQTWHFLDASRLEMLVGGHVAHPALAALL